MATVRTLEELLTVWGSVVGDDDPLATLVERGVVVDPRLMQAVAADHPRRLPRRQRDRLNAVRGRRSGSVAGEQPRFHLGSTRSAVTTELPAGEYDVVLGVRLEVPNEVLAGLYETGEWPHAVVPDVARGIFSLDDLRALSDDVPDLQGLTIGTLHLPSAPTLTSTGTDSIRLNQPFRLDLDVVSADQPRGVTVSALSGDLRLAVPVTAREDGTELTIQLGSTTQRAQDAAASEIDIAADSDILPRNASALSAFSGPLIGLLYWALLPQSITVCPTLQLPVDGNLPIRVRRVDIRTQGTTGGVGALVLGVLLTLEDEDPNAEAGSPGVLTRDPFGQSVASVYVRIHEAFLNKVAAHSLATVSSAVPELPLVDIDVRNARVDLRSPDVVRLTIEAAIPDACGPGPFNFVDLDFDVRADLTATIFGGEVLLAGDPVIDLDNTDVALCAISSGLDLATGVFGVEGLAVLIGLVWGGLVDPDDRTFDLDGIVDVRTVIPGTELVPRIEVLQARVEREVLEVLGVLSVIPDDAHIFAYLQLVQRPRVPRPFALDRPVPEATIRVVDQDRPAPPGDDIAIPEEGVRTVFENDRRRTTIETRYEPARDDQLLGSGTTGDDGAVRMMLERRTSGGTVTTTTRHDLLDRRPPVTQVSESTRSVFEHNPDVYFEIALPDGRRVDSRRDPGGVDVLANVGGRRIGEPGAPLILRVPAPPLVVDGG